MKIKNVFFRALLLFSCVFSFAQNNLKVDAIFSSQMVLQQQHKIPVWGTTKPNTKVNATLNGETITTTSDSKGHWKIYFKALKAGGPYSLTIKSENKIKFQILKYGFQKTTYRHLRILKMQLQKLLQ